MTTSDYIFEILTNGGEIVKIAADTIDQAITQVPDYKMVLCSINQRPQEFLAW